MQSVSMMAKRQVFAFVVAEFAYVGVLAVALSLIWFQDRFPITEQWGLHSRSSLQSQIFTAVLGVTVLSPSIGVFLGLIRLLIARDELQSQIDKEAVVMAFVGALAFATFNQIVGLVFDGSSQGMLPWFLIFPVMGVAWLSGQIVGRWHYLSCP